MKTYFWALILLLTHSLMLLTSKAAQADILYEYYNQNTSVSERDTSVKRPLILWIHGCRQKADTFVAVTDIIEKTKSLNPIIIAPYQDSKLNVLKCWNFFSDEMQKRDGEFMAVIKEVQKHIDSGEADPERIFVGGFSSGAIFAQPLVLCFPELFKAALLHSGGPFDYRKAMNSKEGVVTGAKEALACASTHLNQRRLKNILYFHGKKDHILPWRSGLSGFVQAVHYFDLNDDTEANHSFEFKQSLDQEKLNIAVKFPDGTALEFVRIENMSHRWSGSHPGSAFSSPETMSSVDMFLNMTNNLK